MFEFNSQTFNALTNLTNLILAINTSTSIESVSFHDISNEINTTYLEFKSTLDLLIYN